MGPGGSKIFREETAQALGSAGIRPLNDGILVIAWPTRFWKADRERAIGRLQTNIQC